MFQKRALFPAVIILFTTACTEDPVPVAAASLSPPQKSVTTQGGAVIVDVEPGVDLPQEQAAFRRGVGTYFKEYLPSWSSEAPGSDATLALICDADVRGITNCDDVAYDCVLKHGPKTVDRFERVLKSQSCGRPTMAAREVQSFNHAQELGNSVVDALAGYDGLEGAVAEQELAQARKSPENDALQALIKRYPDTSAAEQAAAIIAARNAPPATPAPSTRTAAAAQSTPKPRPAAQNSSTGASLSCYDARNALCGDYTFPTVAERDKFARQCRSLGSRVLPGKCDTNGAFGCAFSAPNGNRTVTWVFNLGRAQVQASCPTPVIKG